MKNKKVYLRKQARLVFLNRIKLQGLRKEAVERGFTPFRKNIIIEGYAVKNSTEYFLTKKGIKKSNSVKEIILP